MNNFPSDFKQTQVSPQLNICLLVFLKLSFFFKLSSLLVHFLKNKKKNKNSPVHACWLYFIIFHLSWRVVQNTTWSLNLTDFLILPSNTSHTWTKGSWFSLYLFISSFSTKLPKYWYDSELCPQTSLSYTSLPITSVWVVPPILFLVPAAYCCHNADQNYHIAPQPSYISLFSSWQYHLSPITWARNLRRA